MTTVTRAAGRLAASDNIVLQPARYVNKEKGQCSY
jgi:hypothetical protein